VRNFARVNWAFPRLVIARAVFAGVLTICYVIIEDFPHLVAEARQQVRSQRIRGVQRDGQFQPPPFAAINLHLLHQPIDDPVFLNVPTRIEIKLGFTVTLFVGTGEREDFDNQFRRAMKVSVRSQNLMQSFVADPDNIRDDVMIS
jgi:hypothetical protein